MSKSRNKNYIPSKLSNPLVFDKKLESLKDKIEKNKQQHDLMYNALEKHIEYLSNFTSHDIKNAIQNMDSVVSSLDLADIKQEDIDTIKTCLNNIRQSLENFSNLVPNSNKKEFHLSELCKASELINRAVFKKKKIFFEAVYDKSNHTNVNQPYHNLLQILNNLILNAIKALENTLNDKKIKLICKVDNEFAYIYVCDNGCGIVDEIKEKIFDIYFTTTKGSGIGLYHAKYTLEKIKGHIQLIEKFDNFVTIFELKIPIKDDKINIDN